MKTYRLLPRFLITAVLTAGSGAGSWGEPASAPARGPAYAPEVSVSAENSNSHFYRQLVRTTKGPDTTGPRETEVGGPFIGVKTYRGSPLLSRISFFYPVANSIELSGDYWNQDRSRAMFLGLKIGDKPKEWIGLEPYNQDITPFSAAFHKRDDEKSIDIAYEFCKEKPAMTAEIRITNESAASEFFELYTHLEASIRTSHTFAPKDKAWTEFDGTGSAVYVNFDDPETGKFQVFVANAGQAPESFATDSAEIGLPAAKGNWWKDLSSDLSRRTIPRNDPKRPAAAFVYRKELAPGETMTIVQIIGSAGTGEGRELVRELLGSCRQEVELYKKSALDKAYRDAILKTGDSSIDHSVHWAKALLAANVHYIDGDMVPMPCPAEYNFFFTHDVLLTSLAAVYFDPARVKRDLEYIVRRAKPDGVIPHAYYWKDGRYVTEYAAPDNWNHFWFVIVSARYLRHSRDIETLQKLYPFMARSITETLRNKKGDDLIWASRPDWWDLGSSFGPRSYMTVLAVRALREFNFVSAVLGKTPSEMARYEELADRMQKQLNLKLWDEDKGYLMNYYADGSKDPHLYAGSLIAAHFNVIDDDGKKKLVRTAKSKLLDRKLGIYNAVPADFHLLKDYLNLKGDEAGAPYAYMNGGIWPHGNAWFDLALISADRKDEAFSFIKDIMTVDGIADSPNGYPAMYEFRNSNKGDPSAYGRIYKPQFMWAGAWYLYSLYSLLGVRENEWGISFEPWLPDGQDSARFTVFLGGRPVTVTVAGSGRHIKEIEYGGRPLPSAVVPDKTPAGDDINIKLGIPKSPYIASTGSMLLSAGFEERKKSLTFVLKAFPGHRNVTKVISPVKPGSILINGKELTGWTCRRNNGVYEVTIVFSHLSDTDTVEVLL